VRGAGIESHVIDSYLNYNFHGRTCVLLSLFEETPMGEMRIGG
jgi:hypothetical protein